MTKNVTTKGGDNVNYGEELKEKLIEKNMTVTLLAKRIGVSRESVYRWLGGKCLPTKEMQEKINHVLGLKKIFVKPTKIIPAQAAELLGISLPTFYAGMRAGSIPIGSAWQTNKNWSYLISPELLKNYVGERIFNEYFGEE